MRSLAIQNVGHVSPSIKYPLLKIFPNHWSMIYLHGYKDWKIQDNTIALIPSQGDKKGSLRFGFLILLTTKPSLFLEKRAMAIVLD